MQARCISLLTDFGLKDEYVGVMKGVILSWCPTAQIVDISHAVPPQNIIAAARILAASYPFFPQKTLHLTVVDPGVGTGREIILAEEADHLFVAPDNGILTPILSSKALNRCYFYKKPEGLSISNTFHGRDLLAPIAGQIISGTDIEQIGIEVSASHCHRIDMPRPEITKNSIIGQVVMVDHFGNLASSIAAEDIERYGSDITVAIAGVTISGLYRTYAETADRELLALIDSRGYLEIAMNCGNAARLLNCNIGEKIEVRPIQDK